MIGDFKKRIRIGLGLLRHPIPWGVAVLCAAWMGLTTPVLLGDPLGGMGARASASHAEWKIEKGTVQPGLSGQVVCRAGAAERMIRLWIPPLVPSDVFLSFEGNGMRCVRRIGGERWLPQKANGSLIGFWNVAGFGGIQEFQVDFQNRDGLAKFSLVGGASFGKGFVFGIGAVLVLVMLGGLVIEPSFQSLLLFGALLRFLYGFAVPWNIYSPDLGGHLRYILLVADAWRIPDPAMGWQCYQPPLYYLVGAALYRLAIAVGAFPPDVLRVASLLVSCATMTLGAFAVDRFLKGRRYASVGRLLVIFWPASIFFAPVINNDVLVHAFGTTSMFFLAGWLEKGGKGRIVVAAFLGGLAYLTKSNGCLYVAAILIGVAVGYPKAGYRAAAWRVLRIGLPLLLMLAAVTWMNVQRVSAIEGARWPVGNIGTLERHWPNLKMEKNIWDFIPSPSQLWTGISPQSSTEEGGAFAHGFWSVFLRTALVEPGCGNRWVVCFLSILTLALGAMAFRGAWECKMKEPLPWLLSVIFLAAAMAFRWQNPFSCSANFRYVLGVVVPGSVLVVRGIECGGGWEKLGLLAVRLFTGFSILLYLLLISHAMIDL